MSTTKYLSSILKILPAVQARQISELLQSLQVSGRIRNATEYEAKLQELSSLINSSSPQPTFEQIRALVWSLCSSGTHNTMMTAVKNDIEAAFLQVDEIGEKLEDHHILFIQNMLADLERNITEQENTVRRLEWLANQSNEFSKVLANNFSSASLLRVPRSDLEADTLYYDNRTFRNKQQTDLPSAVVSERGRKLILDVDAEPVINPIEVKLHTDDSSYGTDINVDYDTDIRNIIDGQRGTFWTRTVYLKEKVPEVHTILEFNLGAAKDISYIIIEGATPEEFEVQLIQGIAPDGHRVNLVTSAVTVNGKTRIDFPQTFLKSVLVTFSVKTYRRAEYYITGQEKLFDVFSVDNKFARLVRKDSLAPVIRQAFSSENLADLCNVPDTTATQISSYAYTFALDNVWFGNSLYVDSGIFVSTPLKLDNVGVLAVQADESSETGNTVNSIEYEIIKIDRSPKYKEYKFPIPVLGSNTVKSERLILTNRETNTVINDVGMLRFLPYVASTWTTGDADPITVYKNGEAISSSDWDFAIAESSLATNWTLDWKNGFSNATSWEETVSQSGYKLSPPKMWIKIKNPELNSVYTVDYTIRTSDSHPEDDNHTIWLDKDKTIWLLDGGRVNFRQEDPDIIVKSDIFLQITLRRNLASRTTSPELHEYVVLATSYT
jgi:hypothetical protein